MIYSRFYRNSKGRHRFFFVGTKTSGQCFFIVFKMSLKFKIAATRSHLNVASKTSGHFFLLIFNYIPHNKQMHKLVFLSIKICYQNSKWPPQVNYIKTQNKQSELKKIYIPNGMEMSDDFLQNFTEIQIGHHSSTF